MSEPAVFVTNGTLTICRLTASQMSMGRGLRRMIDMFHSPRDLIAERNRRADLEDPGEMEEYTDECVSNKWDGFF